MNARLSLTTALALPVLALLALPLLSTSETAHPALAGKYIGAAKCKNCHSSAESGDQYGAWEKAKHSHAFKTLAESAEAKEAAAKVGITEPAKDDSCVKCHVTGHGEPAESFARGWKPEAGVQCETCHGPNEDHMKARFKAAASGEKIEGYQGVAVDEVIVSPKVDVCVQCHNPESPSYKPFCYYEARGKIAHLDPRKPRSEEEKARFGLCPHGSPCPHAAGCPDGTCNLTPEELAELTAKFKE